MLTEPDGNLRITDFGLALALRPGKFGGATSQSGTPMFASPEQLLGERVDQRSDLYSLAAVAWFALLDGRLSQARQWNKCWVGRPRTSSAAS
jgi:serine/threonine-protein kinase